MDWPAGGVPGREPRQQRPENLAATGLNILREVGDSEAGTLLGFFHLRTAFLARPPGVVIPEVEHGLAEMLHDVATIEIDVFY